MSALEGLETFFATFWSQFFQYCSNFELPGGTSSLVEEFDIILVPIQPWRKCAQPLEASDTFLHHQMIQIQFESRIIEEITDLEKDTGFKLRVLAQNYPETPGLAIKDFWLVDDNTVVFVADPTFGNILNFNVGASVDLDIPRTFWSRLAGKYGNIFYWREKGEDASIEAAVSAISTCLREPLGPSTCSEIK